ncbi:uncharacterized protein LOC124648229 [Lolium rigidum]|uniref:uncharacterized protein LOC124648229 n=1 Tax=Lolium rigidum TaxID=89674 RepID=UPI001F5DF2A8|nr:uncharacterized protein LOC124648229 [Lolium rigidum]
MGAPQSKPKPKPPAMTLVPQPFDFPPDAARTRMAVPAYDLMFGKLSLRRLFDDYYPRQPGMNVDAQVLLKPPREAHLHLTTTMSNNNGEALLRWQRDLDDPHTFVDLLMSSSKSMLQLRSCAYYPKYGIGAFGTFPLLMEKRACSKDYGVMGLRYASENLSVGASFVPFPSPDEVPYGAWLVGRKGRFSGGLQYKPLAGRRQYMPYTDLKNWNCAISYGTGSTSPLSNPFMCTLELIGSAQLVASAYQRQILQRRENYHLGDDHIIGALGYVDFGLELATRVDKDKPADSADKSLFQLAASFQPNSYLLVKGKLGTSKYSAALVCKLPPYFRLSVTAENDHSKGTSYGLGICIGEVMEPCYHTVNSDGTVLTKTEERFDGEKTKRTFQFDPDAGEFDNLPTEMKPIDKIL